MEWFSTSRHFVLERFVDKKKLINPILKKGRRHTSKENGEVLFLSCIPNFIRVSNTYYSEVRSVGLQWIV